MTVLFALLIHPGRSLGTTDIMAMTGYSDKTVTKALHLLSAPEWGLVQRHARYTGWTATHRIRQMILGELPSPEGHEPEILRFPSSSSSSSLSSSPDKKQLLPPNEPEILRFPIAWEPVAEAMMRVGAPPDRAANAIQNAITHNFSPAQTLTAIDDWTTYCNSPAGQSINNPGALIASRIATGTPAPTWWKERQQSQGDYLCPRCHARPCLCTEE